MLRVFLSLVLAVCCNIALFAQNNVTFSVQNKPIKDVISLIQHQTNYKFMYNTQLVDVNQVISVNCNAMSVESALDKIFDGTGISWKIADNQIVLSAANKSAHKAVQQENIKVKGVVKDAITEETLPGVVITVLETQKIALTDIDGKYEVEAPANATLNFTFMGMKEANVKVGGKAVINVDMDQDVTALDDVVVTGYQTLSKERATGSFAVISSKDMETKLNTNVMDRLEGAVAGMNIVKNGGSKKIEIRGVSTINGNKEPLYVVDGVPYEGDIDAINPSDIANVTVLKDATAASIYGARSANGVIVITTKTGQVGKTKVNYSANVSFQGLPDREYSNRMNSEELVNYQDLMMQVFPNVRRQAQNRYQNPVQVLLMDHRDGLIDRATLDQKLAPYKANDRYEQVKDEFLRNFSVVHQHNLSFSGGSDIYKYSISFNYMGDAPYEKAQYKNRIGFNVRNTFDFFKWLQVDANIMGSIVDYDYDNGIAGMDLLNRGGSSYYMLRDEAGNPVQWYDEKSQHEIDRLNSLGLQDETYFPVNELGNQHYTYKSNYLNMNLGAKIRIIEGLNVSLRFQRETTTGFNKQYWTKHAANVKTMINDATQITDDGKIKNIIPQGGQILQRNMDDYSYTGRAQVDYNKTFNPKHRLQALIGAEMRKVVSSGNGFYRVGYDDDNLAYSKIDELALTQGIYGTQAVWGSYWHDDLTPDTYFKDNRYVSFYGNASYVFNNDLTVTGSIRIDQSNLFGTDPKYQYRPLWSVGAHYVALKNHDWIDRLVVRATYGINGNIPKLNGPYLIANVGRNNYYTQENTMFISTPPNETLRWEKTKVVNIGVDFNFLKNRLNGTIDFYNKNTSDLLGPFSTDPTLGWSSVDMNFGSMVNRGLELTLASRNIDNGKLLWTTNVTFSYNKNKITDIETSSESASSYWGGLNNRKGYPMGALFSVRYKGLNEEGCPVAYKKDGTEVLDYTKLTKEDLVYSGTYNPPFNASMRNTLSYKGFDLSFMFIYSGGHVKRDVAASNTITSHPIYAVSNTDRDRANFWRKPGDENIPGMNPAFMFQSKARNGVNIWKAADKHIQKGDFIKLRDLSLSYNLPSQLLKKSAVSSVRFTFQANNVWWWAANDSKLDPEIWTGYNLSPSRGTLYPAEFTFGFNIGF